MIEKGCFDTLLKVKAGYAITPESVERKSAIKDMLKSQGYEWRFNSEIRRNHGILNIRNDESGKRFWFTESEIAKKGLTQKPTQCYINNAFAWFKKVTQSIAPKIEDLKPLKIKSHLTVQQLEEVRKVAKTPVKIQVVDEPKSKVIATTTTELSQPTVKTSKKLGRAVEDLIGAITNLKN